VTVYDGAIDLSMANNSRTRLVRWIPAKSRVLEVGCATGFMAEYLTRRLACRVTGVERDPEAARIATGRCERLIVGDVEEPDLIARCAGEYDTIVFADVLEHLRDPEVVLRSLARYLAPGGRVLASIPNVAHWSIRWRLLAGRWNYQDRGILDRSHLRFFTRRSAHALFARAGLTVTRATGVYGFPRVFNPPETAQPWLASTLPGVLMIPFILEGAGTRAIATPAPGGATTAPGGAARAPGGRVPLTAVTICLVARRVWTHGLGGMEEHCRNLAIELGRQGHTLHVLTTAHLDGRSREEAYGATVHYLHGTPPGDYSSAWWRESRLWAREHFERLGVDAVLSMSMAAYGLVGHAGPPIYTIVVGWGLNQLRSYWHDSTGVRRLVEFPRSMLSVLATLPKGRALLRASELVLPVSRELERQLRGYRVCRVPNFIETSEFAENPPARAEVRARLGFADQDCVALMVGTLTRQKGIHLGLRACAAAARVDPALAVIVVGGGPEAAPLEAATRRQAPHLRVAFVGARPHADVARFYAAADMFLLPSLRQEGLPTTLLEAMASRLPIVAMRAGGAPSGVTHGETGLLVPLGDVRAFADALGALVADPDRRRTMGRAGYARALTEFDQAVVVRRLVDIMKGAPC